MARNVDSSAKVAPAETQGRPDVPPLDAPGEAAAAPVREHATGRGSPGPETAAPQGGADRSTGGPASSRWWLRRIDQVFLALLVAICVALVAWYQLTLSGWGRQPVEIKRLPEHELDYRIDLNRASWVEWAQLPGIGRALAERIVEDRKTNGRFASIEALERVRGIGPKTVERLRPYLYVDGTNRADGEHDTGGDAARAQP